jgi:hypothetical protein
MCCTLVVSPAWMAPVRAPAHRVVRSGAARGWVRKRGRGGDEVASGRGAESKAQAQVKTTREVEPPSRRGNEATGDEVASQN